MESLPSVAKNFFYHCTKCGSDRYHRVLAHLSATEARLECEVCGSKKKYSIAKKAPTTRKAAGKGAKSATKGVPRGHAENYRQLMDNVSNFTHQPYSLTGSFSVNTLISHPNFGEGVVISSTLNRIEVCFEDGIKTLLHKKTQ